MMNMNMRMVMAVLMMMIMLMSRIRRRTEKLPNMMRAQKRVNSLMPDSSKLSRSISPKAAQNRV